MAILKYKLKTPMGLGTAPLGNLFRNVPEEEAQETIQSAWDAGVRYFDTAPLYGAGLAEARLGEVFKNTPREEYLLSTKVGRIIKDETEKKEGLFEHGRQNQIEESYTEEAVLRSIEQSLERLQTDRLDVVYVHDISPDFHGDHWHALFEEARTGAFPALERLKSEGVIQDWGIGVNTTVPIEMALELEDAHPTLSLQATHYTLLKHERSLQRLMPLSEKKGTGIVTGAPYNAGVLFGGDSEDYAPATPETQHRVREISRVAEKHGISLKAAALQFPLAHPAVEAVIPGSTRPGRIHEDLAALKEMIPAGFWQDLREAGLIAPDAPVPQEK
ncbi:aldo/keto reductase [Alkalicoccus chagannorensis]|uniref:aldo/keto reductase n=1 Tax=Alkalicoccus chagannorensis TaxID=427072 RepID=UPI0003F9AECF|nr:aldo/keto reductase [Alkalicoccus chagannorensis]